MNKDTRDFRLFARDRGISSLNQHYYSKAIEDSMTPYILEERTMNVTQMDVFSRLMMDRILWIAGPVTGQMATIVQAQLLFLDSLGENDINMYIDSPGGSVVAGLSMVDVMEFIDPDIQTVNAGMAASMGSVLLGAGTKGKRFSLPSSRTMLHQSSAGVGGNIQDAEIEMEEWRKMNDILFQKLGSYTDKTAAKVKKDASRNLWLSATEAQEYGIVDSILTKKPKRR